MPYDSKFPNEIDLGRQVPDYSDMPCAPASPSTDDDSKCKMKTIYPCLYINGVEAVKDIPADGWALIKFHRSSLTTRDRDDDKTEVSCELDVCEICLPDDGDMGDLEESFAEFMKSRKSE